MVLLLNVLPYILLFGLGYWAVEQWKRHKTLKSIYSPLGLIILVLVGYPLIQPSYLPKGKIERTAVPSLEQSEGVIKDVTPKPVPGEVRDQNRKEQFNERTPYQP